MKQLLMILLCLACLCAACGPRSDETSPEMAQRMIKLRGFDYDEDGFFRAIRAKDAPTVQLFLQSGMDPNVKNKNGETALTFAVVNSDLDTIENLAAKADLSLRDGAGNTPLFVALKKQNFPVFEYLLGKGADPNSSGTVGSIQNQTALYVAVLIDRPDIIQQLLEKGADPQIADNGGSMPISEQVLAQSPNLETFQLILDRMKDVNQPEKDGSTLLIYAAKNKQMSAGKRQEIIKRLLEKGADKNLKDKKGKTALDYAKENKQPEAIEALK
jgi:ankyrin repeat protein